jgi:hypothetical protein
MMTEKMKGRNKEGEEKKIQIQNEISEKNDRHKQNNSMQEKRTR